MLIISSKNSLKMELESAIKASVIVLGSTMVFSTIVVLFILKPIAYKLYWKYGWEARNKARMKVAQRGVRFEPKMGTYLNNSRCHKNSLNYAIRHKQPTIALCYYVSSDGEVEVHFVNYSNGTYYDNTMGNLTSSFSYYLIRLIDQNDFQNLDDILGQEQAEIDRVTPFWVKMLILLL